MDYDIYDNLTEEQRKEYDKQEALKIIENPILKQLQEDENYLHHELLKHVKAEGSKKFFEILQQYIDNQIELEKHCNQ